jgi:GntR family transcriptional regulator
VPARAGLSQYASICWAPRGFREGGFAAITVLAVITMTALTARMLPDGQSVKGVSTVIAMTYGEAGKPPAARTGARYRVLADELTERIEKGEFEAGSKLPTEGALIKEYGVSITTVRAAMRILNQMGLAETRHGTGTFVTARTLLQIHATHFEDLDLRNGVTAQDSWSTDVLSAGRTPSQRFECLNVEATKEVALLLGVEAGSALVMRRCWRFVDDVPSSIETSLYPAWLVEQVPALAGPRDIAQGTTSYLADHGFTIHWHKDRDSSRPPTREEEAFFEAPAGVSVLVRLRISYDNPDGRALRITEAAYRADMHELVYDVPGRGNPVYPNPLTTSTDGK